MIRRLSLLIVSAGLFLGQASGACAAALVRDLGRGLAYVRIHALPGDLPAALPAGTFATALDLRYVGGDDGAALALATWVRARATRHSPVFLLTNGLTSPLLLMALAAQPPQGLVFVGTASRSFTPDVVLTVSRDADRRAYEALEHGAPVESLLSDNPGKPRVDEEMLEREHLSDSDLPDPDTTADSDAADKAPPPLVDVILQRAVQLHRGLLALRRL